MTGDCDDTLRTPSYAHLYRCALWINSTLLSHLHLILWWKFYRKLVQIVSRAVLYVCRRPPISRSFEPMPTLIREGASHGCCLRNTWTWCGARWRRATVCCLTGIRCSSVLSSRVCLFFAHSGSSSPLTSRLLPRTTAISLVRYWLINGWIVSLVTENSGRVVFYIFMLGVFRTCFISAASDGGGCSGSNSLLSRHQRGLVRCGHIWQVR